MRSNYKTAAILFAILFALGFMVGAIFNGLNTIEWPNQVKIGFCFWAMACVGTGLIIIFEEKKP